jgi:hypothetical protein
MYPAHENINTSANFDKKKATKLFLELKEKKFVSNDNVKNTGFLR